MRPTSEGRASDVALDEGLQALGLALDAPARQRLLDYLDLIARWSRVINLTAIRDPQAMLAQHLLDSLAVVPALRRRVETQHAAQAPAEEGKAPGLRLLDVGSGAGLPGAVLAIAGSRWQLTCVDAVAKKAAFIRQAAAELGLPNLNAVHARVEDLPAAQGYDVITSRAFASLRDFVTLTAHLLAPGGCWMAMKGKVPDEEIAALPDGVEVFHVEPLAVPGLDAQRCLVWMRKKTS